MVYFQYKGLTFGTDLHRFRSSPSLFVLTTPVKRVPVQSEDEFFGV